MTKKNDVFNNLIGHGRGIHIENALLVGLISFYFLKVGLANNPIFSFTYHQGFIIALFIILAIVFSKFSFRQNKNLSIFLLVWLIYSGIINVFSEGNQIDIAFITKMSIFFLLYAVLKTNYITEKKLLAVMFVILFSFLLYGMKMLQFVVLNYNFTTNGENSSVIGIAIAFGLLVVIPIIRFKTPLNLKTKKILKTILYLLGMGTSYLIGARTIVLIILFTTVIDVCLPMKLKRKKTFFVMLFALVYVLGIFFPILYVQLVESSSFFSVHDFLTGREVVWQKLLAELKVNVKLILFGYGRDRQYGRWPHEHNAYLALIMRYGVVGLILFTSFWINEVRHFFKKTKITDFQFAMAYNLLPVLLMSYTEPIFAVADYFVPIAFILMLAFGSQKHITNNLEV